MITDTSQGPRHEINYIHGGYSENRSRNTGIRHSLVVIGIFEVFIGIASAACSISALVITAIVCHVSNTENNYPYYYYQCREPFISESLVVPGFWTGLFATVTGIFSVVLGSVRSAKIARASGAFSILLLACSSTMIGLEFDYIFNAGFYYYYNYTLNGLHWSLASFGILLFVFSIVTAVLSFVLLGNKCCCCCNTNSRTAPEVIPMVNQAFIGPPSVNKNNLTTAPPNYQNFSNPNAKENTMFNEFKNVPSTSAQVSYERQRSIVLPGVTRTFTNTDMMQQSSSLQSQQQYRAAQQETPSIYPNVQQHGHHVPPAPSSTKYSAPLPPLQPAPLPQIVRESTSATVQIDGGQQNTTHMHDQRMPSTQTTNLTQPMGHITAAMQQQQVTDDHGDMQVAGNESTRDEHDGGTNNHQENYEPVPLYQDNIPAMASN